MKLDVITLEAGKAGAGLETCKHDLVGGDRDQAGQGNLQNVMVEERDAEQCCGEEDEVDGDACDGWSFCTRRCQGERGGKQGQETGCET